MKMLKSYAHPHKHVDKNLYFRIVLSACGIALLLYNVGSIVLTGRYFYPYYTESMYKHLENLFDNSQYRQKNPTSIIADEIVFRYAAGAYLRGVDPILINSEHTPLGKYFFALSIWAFRTDTVATLFFAVATLGALWLLASEVLHDRMLAVIPVVAFSFDRLYQNQLRVTPLLDIIQLPFIILAIYMFLKEYPKKLFVWTGLLLGFVMATKSIVPAILLFGAFFIFLILVHKPKRIIGLFSSLSLALLVLVGSYIRTFQNGHTFGEFIGYQKWILLYQQSKLIYPLSFWRLVYFNQWQAWWGNKGILKAEDWTIAWPVLISIPFVAIFWKAWRKIQCSPEIMLLAIWIIVYECFLSLGIISTRFMLPLIPVLYIFDTFIFVRLLLSSGFLGKRYVAMSNIL